MTGRLQHKNSAKHTPSTDPVSVGGRLLAAHRGYTDAGSVQAKAEYRFSAVAYQSAVHRHGVGGAVKTLTAGVENGPSTIVVIISRRNDPYPTLQPRQL